jgi:hypothetical protein
MGAQAAFEFHPFMADRFAEAVVPALMILVVDHDARPLERLVERCAVTDAKWMDAQRARAHLKAAVAAIEPLPRGTPPEDLVAVHDVGKDAHTGRDAIVNPPVWTRALNAVAFDLCVATRRTPGWNPGVLAVTGEGESLERFVGAARILHPEALGWYSKLAGGLFAWLQGGALRGFLTRAEVSKFRESLEADERQMFFWKDRGGDFHRRKLQAFCFLAQKHNLGLAATAPAPVAAP